MATFDYLRRNGESVEQMIKRQCETYYEFKKHTTYWKYLELCNEQYDLFYKAVNTEYEEQEMPPDEDPLSYIFPPTERDLAIEAFNKHVYKHGNLMDWLRNNKHGNKNWIDKIENPKCLLTDEEIEACKKRIVSSKK